MNTPPSFPATPLRFTWHYLKDYKFVQVIFFLVAVVWAIDLSLSPYLLKHLIDLAGLPNSQLHPLSFLWPCVFYASMPLLIGLTFRFYDYALLTLVPDLKTRIGQDMFDYLLFHSYGFFQDHFSGSLTKKIFDLVDSTEKIITIFNEWFYPRLFALGIAASSMSLVVQPVFGLVLVLWTALFVTVSYFGARKLNITSTHLSSQRATMSGAISDAIANMLSTLVFANSRHESQRIKTTTNEVKQSDRQLRWQQLIMNAIQSVIVVVQVVIMLSLLVHYRVQGSITAGDFAFILTVSMFINMSVWQIGTQILEFSKALGTARQAMSFITLPHEITDVTGATPLVIHQGTIAFTDVNFHFRHANGLFKQFNLTIEAGQRVGLVGHSGGGKTSLVNLILRLMEPQSGQITIDGQDIQTCQLHSLRSQITTITQETALFHRTIMDNIRFARPDADDEAVIAAAKKAHCHEFILSLPEGYQSEVGERGVKLSGGQKQRIAIARAFLKDAPILLIDEATSALDSQTERDIQAGLHDIMQGKTVIVIAHRLSTLKDMDRILVLEQGRIAEDGAHSTLLTQNGPYKQLWDAQVGGMIGT